MEVTQIIILVVLLYALYVICGVGDRKKEEEGFGNIGGNSNYVVYGNVGEKNLKNGGVELSNGKVYNRNLSLDYENSVLAQNRDLVYYYNDVIDQSKINETAHDIEFGVDTIDFGNVLTGFEKCEKNCNGECIRHSYDGVGICYPYPQQSYDLGTLYKNPSFTLGISDNN